MLEVYFHIEGLYSDVLLPLFLLLLADLGPLVLAVVNSCLQEPGHLAKLLSLLQNMLTICSAVAKSGTSNTGSIRQTLIMSQSIEFITENSQIQKTQPAAARPTHNRHLPPCLRCAFRTGQSSTRSAHGRLLLSSHHDQQDVFEQGSPDSLVTVMKSMFSAATGWIPMVSSRIYLVRPILMATAKPCMTYPALGPAQCRPTTLLPLLSITALAQMVSLVLLPSSSLLSKISSSRAQYLIWYTSTLSLPKFCMALYSLSPQVEYQRGVKTVVGKLCKSVNILPLGNCAPVSLLTILRPRFAPILTAVEVSSGRPSTTSPRAQIFYTFVFQIYLGSVRILLLLGAVLMPTLSKFRLLVVALRPTANKTVSYTYLVTYFVFWFVIQASILLPQVRVNFVGSDVSTMLTFFRSLRCMTTYLTMSRSKALRQSPRVIKEVSQPNPCKKPAIQTATQPPPTTNVLPGGVFLKKMSSLVMASSAPGISKYCGRVPVAITKFLAFTWQILSVPSGSCWVQMNFRISFGSLQQRRVLLSMKLAIALRQSMLSSPLMLLRQPKFIDFM